MNYSDVLRKKNPHKKSFTYQSKHLKVQSRINFVLVSTFLIKSVLDIDSKTSIAPDHKAVKIKILVIVILALDYGNLIIPCWKMKFT